MCIIIIRSTVKEIRWFMMHYLETVTEFLHLFSSRLVEMTTPSSRIFPMEADTLEVHIPRHSLPIPLLQDLGRGKPSQSSLEPILFQSRRGAIPKIWAKGRRRGAPLVSVGWGSAADTSQLLLKRKIIKDLQELMAKLSLPPMGADSILLLRSPSPAGNCPGRTPLKSLGLFAFGGFLSLKIKINPSTWLELWPLNQCS